MADKILHRMVKIAFLILFFLACPINPIISQENIYINSLEMEFVLIPSGRFIMGSPEDEIGRDGKGKEQQHEVSIHRPFYIQAMVFDTIENPQTGVGAIT